MGEVPIALSDEQIAREVALDIPDGSFVNLGIGLPSLVARQVPQDREVVFHCENGVVGMGPPPPPGQEDWHLIDAGKQPITLLPGGSYLDHAASFALVRGAHLDLAVMGAFEVSDRGDLANWSTGEGIPAVGGAMDLAVGAGSVWVMMRHTTRDGRPKLVSSCSLPLTAGGVVRRVYTDLGIFDVADGRVRARGLVRDRSIGEVAAATGCTLTVPCDCLPLPRTEGNAREL